MENASKALIMAGGIFIAILIITLLVFFYNNIVTVQNADEQAEIIEQSTEFNKQYDVYNRNNLYGSEILSLANKMEDYNRKEAVEKGYPEMEMEVTINDNVGTYFTRGTYSAEQLQTALANLQAKEEEYANVSYCGRRISDLSTMRTNELQQLFEDNHNTGKLAEAQAVITRYVTLKAEETEMRTKGFRCAQVVYDDQTGRIILMKFSST